MLKQIEGRDLKQSERNRLSRDIRPKLDVVRKLSEFKDEFALERNQENKRVIENAIGVVLSDELGEDVKAMLLFGSFVDGSFTARSDIDICVVFDRKLSLKEATEFRVRVSGELPDKVDIQVFGVLPQKVKRSVARNHKVLFSRKDYDNVDFSIKYLKDDDYFIRLKKLGVET
jgi:uncharacterized protein